MEKNSLPGLENPRHGDWFNIPKRVASENEKMQELKELCMGIVPDPTAEVPEDTWMDKLNQVCEELPGVRQEKRSSASNEAVSI